MCEDIKIDKRTFLENPSAIEKEVRKHLSWRLLLSALSPLPLVLLLMLFLFSLIRFNRDSILDLRIRNTKQAAEIVELKRQLTLLKVNVRNHNERYDEDSVAKEILLSKKFLDQLSPFEYDLTPLFLQLLATSTQKESFAVMCRELNVSKIVLGQYEDVKHVYCVIVNTRCYCIGNEGFMRKFSNVESFERYSKFKMVKTIYEAMPCPAL